MIIKAREAQSIVDRTKGLIGSSTIEPLFFKTRFGIHTFGMKKPIDVIILDENNQVCRTCSNLKPWRIFIWNPKYNKVLELPSGYIRNEKIKKGDQLKPVIIPGM